MNTAALEISPKPARAQKAADRYLTIGLEEESYGIPSLHIREILRMSEVMAMPQMAAYMRGVLNLQGRIVPVVDLRRRLDRTFDGLDERICVVVVQIATATGAPRQMGLVVERVGAVVDLDPEEIEAPSQFGSMLTAANLLGLVRIKAKAKPLPDLDKVVAAEHLFSLAEAA